jgi:hypothetical protein
MSSFPLISHHLFVAAVKEKNCDSQMSGRLGQEPASPEIQIKEVPVELLDYGNPLDVSGPPDNLSWTGST